MSFVQQFAMGQNMAQTAMDAFQRARMQRDLGRVADAKPQELVGFNAQDGDQLRAMAEARDEQGNPLYTIEDDQKGGLRVLANFGYAGQDGQQVAPGAEVGMAPRRMTDFLGQRVEGTITPERMEGMRYRAKADVVGRTDPVLGMRMRREATQDEREAQRHARQGVLDQRQDADHVRQTQDREALDRVHAEVAEFMRPNLVDEQGNPRAPTPRDTMAALDFMANRFISIGRTDLAQGSLRDRMAVAGHIAQQETAERKTALAAANFAAASGNFQPLVDVFNRFIPTGHRVGSIVEDASGKVRINFVDAEGKPTRTDEVPNRRTLLAQAASFENPGVLVDFMTNEAKQAQQAAHNAAVLQERRRSGGSSGARAATEAGGLGPTPAEHRAILNDFGRMLPNPDQAVGAEASAEQRAQNNELLAQADQLLELNAQHGIPVRAPTLYRALHLAQDPSNHKQERNPQTGQYRKFVVVNGAKVVIAVGTPPAQGASPAPGAAQQPAAQQPAPGAPGAAARTPASAAAPAAASPVAPAATPTVPPTMQAFAGQRTAQPIAVPQNRPDLQRLLDRRHALQRQPDPSQHREELEQLKVAIEQYHRR